MLSPRQAAVYLKMSGVIGIVLGAVGLVFLAVGLAQGVQGAPVVGLAFGSSGALLSGSTSLVLYRKYSGPSNESD